MPPLLLFADAGPMWRILPALLLGGAAIYLLVPRPRPYPAWWGGAAGALALLLTGILLVNWGASVEGFLFYVFSAVAIVSGVLLITQRNPARAALAFALVVLSSCGLFLLQAAPFLMAATIIIYAGAIIVTFLFVLMLAQQETRSDADWRSREPALASIAGFVLLGALLYVLQTTYHNPKTADVITNLHKILDNLEQLPATATADEAFKAGEQLDKVSAEIARVPQEPALQQFGSAVKDFDAAWFDEKMAKDGPRSAAFLKAGAVRLRGNLVQATRTLGDLQPKAEWKNPQSPFSGPPSSQTIRHDEQGHAPLPAANVAALGRSLFTDYLLAVELGGTLLLVATIGAIAIANRKGGAGAIS